MDKEDVIYIYYIYDAIIYILIISMCNNLYIIYNLLSHKTNKICGNVGTPKGYYAK